MSYQNPTQDDDPLYGDQFNSMYSHNDPNINPGDSDRLFKPTYSCETNIPGNSYNLRSRQLVTHQDYLDHYREQLRRKEIENRRNELLHPNYSPYVNQQNWQRQPIVNIPILECTKSDSNIVITNFKKCIKKINRVNLVKFIIIYIQMELNVKTIKNKKQLIITNYNNINNIQECFQKYIREYVKCRRCNSTNTIVNITSKPTSRKKYYIAHCNQCNMMFAIKHSKEI